ncbi:MAG: M23 family metallopeptidase [Patescibacteria group bacterium]
MAKPFSGIWKFTVKPLVIEIYKIYLKITTRLNKSVFFRNKLGFLAYNRHTVNVIIVIIALCVTSTNVLSANDVRQDNVAKKSNLYKIAQSKLGLDLGSEEEEVVKADLNKSKRVKNYVDTNGLVIANIPEISEKIDVEDSVILLDEGSTLASAALLENVVSKKRVKIIEYEIQEGDTLSTIAEKYDLSLNTILWENGLNSKSVSKVGDTLKILPKNGIIHKVVSGDTFDRIVSQHKGDKQATKDINNIGDNGLIPVGQEILVVDGEPYTPPTPKPVSTPSSGHGSSSSGSLYTPGSGSSVTAGTLNWPSSCRRISQGVRWGHIAIDINCGLGKPIYAAESGVATVIPNKSNGYGNYITINHGNGLQTLYGHFSSFSISNGQSVSRGQQIGWEGSTGWSTGPHLHFEVIKNGAKQNPWNWL